MKGTNVLVTVDDFLRKRSVNSNRTRVSIKSQMQ